jgi:hypothetical protein
MRRLLSLGYPAQVTDVLIRLDMVDRDASVSASPNFPFPGPAPGWTVILSRPICTQGEPGHQRQCPRSSYVRSVS